jgi:hypothetical protein
MRNLRTLAIVTLFVAGCADEPLKLPCATMPMPSALASEAAA